MSAVADDIERKRILSLMVGAVDSPATLGGVQQQRSSVGEPHEAYYVHGSFPLVSADEVYGYCRNHDQYQGSFRSKKPARHEGWLTEVPSLVIEAAGNMTLCPPLYFSGAAIAAFVPQQEPGGPFDQLRDGKVNVAKVVLEHWVAAGQVSVGITSRLRDLIDLSREEYPDTEIPGAQMLESALNFFRSRRDIAPPALALTSGGHLWAQWRRGQHHAAAIEFRKDGSINLAAFFPDPAEPMRTASIAGSYSWKAASSEVRHNRALDWLFRG